MQEIEGLVIEGANSMAYLNDIFLHIRNFVEYKTNTSSISKKTFSSRVLGKGENLAQKKSYDAIEERFKRLVFTRGPILDDDGNIVIPGERVMLPYFGSSFHELIDKNIDLVWKIKLKKYLFECFFDENEKLWDSDFEPVDIVIDDIKTTEGSVSIFMKFKNKMEVEFNV